MSARVRDRAGRFVSALDVQLADVEAEWCSLVQGHMDAGLDFDAAWMAAGGSILPSLDASPEVAADLERSKRLAEEHLRGLVDKTERQNQG